MRSEIVLIVATLGLIPLAGRAQEPAGAVACPSIENDHDRLACYDRAMRGAPRAPAPAQASPAPAPAPAPASAAGPAVVGAAAVGVAAANANSAPASVAPATVAPTTVAPATVAPSTVAPAAASSATVAPATAAPTSGRRACRDVVVDDQHLAAQPAQYDGGDAASARRATDLRPEHRRPDGRLPSCRAERALAPRLRDRVHHRPRRRLDPDRDKAFDLAEDAVQRGARAREIRQHIPGPAGSETRDTGSSAEQIAPAERTHADATATRVAGAVPSS